MLVIWNQIKIKIDLLAQIQEKSFNLKEEKIKEQILPELEYEQKLDFIKELQRKLKETNQ